MGRLMFNRRSPEETRKTVEDALEYIKNPTPEQRAKDMANGPFGEVYKQMEEFSTRINKQIEEDSKEGCQHEKCTVTYDAEAAKGLDEFEIRRRFPRFSGNCPDCGVQLIKYASYEHYIMGDW